MAHFFPLELDGLLMEKVNATSYEIDLLKFRHQVFRVQLGWVPPRPDGLDLDDYDAFSDNLAVIAQQQVVGSARFTPGDQPFMIEREFARLLAPGERIRKGAGCGEITRFAVGKTISSRETRAIARLLYLSLWEWSRANEVRWLYFVVEPSFYRHLSRMGFPIQPVGVPRPLDGGVMSVAGCFDWEQADPEFIKSLRREVAAPRECVRSWLEYDRAHAPAWA